MNDRQINFDKYYDPVGEATDRYLAEYGEAQDCEDYLEYHCKKCAVCLNIIRPEQTAVHMTPWVDRLGGWQDIFIHGDCIDMDDTYTGEELME